MSLDPQQHINESYQHAPRCGGSGWQIGVGGVAGRCGILLPAARPGSGRGAKECDEPFRGPVSPTVLRRVYL